MIKIIQTGSMEVKVVWYTGEDAVFLKNLQNIIEMRNEDKRRNKIE